jgi:hypothetical protein
LSHDLHNRLGLFLQDDSHGDRAGLVPAAHDCR